MPEPTALLDSSALLAYLRDEPGADEVELALERGVAMGVVNWAEVVTVVVRMGGTAAEIRAELAARGILGEDGLLRFVALTSSDAEFAGDLYRDVQSLGMSLGDRVCIATARRLGLVTLTADQSWRALSIPGVVIQFIR